MRLDLLDLAATADKSELTGCGMWLSHQDEPSTSIIIEFSKIIGIEINRLPILYLKQDLTEEVENSPKFAFQFHKFSLKLISNETIPVIDMSLAKKGELQ